MKETVEAQRNYFLEGRTMPLKVRKQMLRKLHDLLLDNERFLADAIYEDFRKSFYLTVENELSIPYGEINYALRHLRRWSRSRRYRTNLVNFPANSRCYPVPYGVTLIIGPWNYPYMLSLVPMVSSLAAGNTVILKPSEVSSHASSALATLINGTFPPEQLWVEEGGPEKAAALLKERFDKIFFTGSSRVGKTVMEAASKHPTPVILELGGKNPVIVMPGCNLKSCAKRLTWGKFHNNGHACVAPDHVFVHESLREELIVEIRRQIYRIYGEDPRKSPILPRVVNRDQFKRLTALIDPEKVVCGGKNDSDTLYIEPTVLDGVEPDDPVMEQEVFGPLLPILSYSNLDVLLERLKRQPSPLMLYIFTGEPERAKKIVRSIPCGGGMVNDVVLSFVNMNTPFGGFGESGMGSYHGKAGFEAFTHYKTVITKPIWFELFLKYPPHRDLNLRIIRGAMGRSFRNFLR